MHAHDTPERLDGRRSAVREPRTCQQCGAEFIPKRQTKGIFCSRACYWAWWGENKGRENSEKGLAKLETLHAEGRDPRATEQATWKRLMAYRDWALRTPPEESEGDDLLWAERAGYWQAQADPLAEEPVFYRRRERTALVLAGHGLRLSIHRGALLVRHGFTHYPQRAREDRYFPGDPKLPSRIILLSADGSLSLDVVRWLSEQGVPLVMLDYQGRVVSVLGSETTAADIGLRRAQIEALANGRGLVLSRSLIERKLKGSISTLETLPPSSAVESAISRVASLLQQLREEPPQSIDDLRLLEAWAAISYFAAWRSIRLRWKGTGKQPIPPEWRRVGMRQDVLRRSNRHARHPVNALLNYGYAVLESQVRIAIAELGLDPTLGYLHVCQPGRQAFVYDLMEPYRPQVDSRVLAFLQSQAFSPRDFVVDAKGACRLHPELARNVAGACVADIDLSSVTESLLAVRGEDVSGGRVGGR